MSDPVKMIAGIHRGIRGDMERQFPNMQLRCTVCDRVEANDWGYLREGWPKCHGYTMTLEAGDALTEENNDE